MYIDFDGHHSGGSSFDMYMIFGFCYKMWAIPTGTSSAFKKKKKVPVYGLAPRTWFGSANWVGPESGRDKLVSEPRFRRFWNSL